MVDKHDFVRLIRKRCMGMEEVMIANHSDSISDDDIEYLRDGANCILEMIDFLEAEEKQ